MEIVVLLVGIVALIVFIVVRVIKNTDQQSTSFSDTLTKAGLPIITLHQEDKEFNFIVDTGANYSVINKADLGELLHKMGNITGSTYGIDGNLMEVGYALIPLQKNDVIYKETFQVVDVSSAFNNIAESSGIKVVGILGNEFLRTYNSIIDFNNLTIKFKNERKDRSKQ